MRTFFSCVLAVGGVALGGCMETQVPLAESDLTKEGLQEEAPGELITGYDWNYGWDFNILPQGMNEFPCDLDPETPPPDCDELNVPTWRTEGCSTDGVCWQAWGAGELEGAWFAGRCWLPDADQTMDAVGWSLPSEQGLPCDQSKGTARPHCAELDTPQWGSISCDPSEEVCSSYWGSDENVWFAGRCWLK